MLSGVAVVRRVRQSVRRRVKMLRAMMAGGFVDFCCGGGCVRAEQRRRELKAGLCGLRVFVYMGESSTLK
jgi:hypothetical protein